MARAGRDEADAQNTVLRRRELGALLRRLRTEKGMTVERVAELLLCSPSKVSRLETGHRGASQRDIRDLCNLYEVDDAQRENLTRLAKEGRGQAWWQPYGLGQSLETYMGLEAAAARICDYEPGVFPGLLQTPDYARVVHEAAVPKLSSAAIEQRIEVRLGRQQILTREEPPPPRLEAIVDEAILHRPIGGARVMRAQIDRVIEACKQPKVSVRVLPFAAGAHPALDSPCQSHHESRIADDPQRLAHLSRRWQGGRRHIAAGNDARPGTRTAGLVRRYLSAERRHSGTPPLTHRPMARDRE